jgi:hypothetical protein
VEELSREGRCVICVCHAEDAFSEVELSQVIGQSLVGSDDHTIELETFFIVVLPYATTIEGYCTLSEIIQ